MQDLTGNSAILRVSNSSQRARDRPEKSDWGNRTFDDIKKSTS